MKVRRKPIELTAYRWVPTTDRYDPRLPKWLKACSERDQVKWHPGFGKVACRDPLGWLRELRNGDYLVRVPGGVVRYTAAQFAREFEVIEE